MNIAQFFVDSAVRRPEHPAVIFEGQHITYSELNRRTDALAWGLKERGIVPGDVVVLMMPNSIDWITVYYAIAKLGAIVLPVKLLPFAAIHRSLSRANVKNSLIDTMGLTGRFAEHRSLLPAVF